MKKIWRQLDRFEEYTLAASLVVTVVLVFYQVMMRYVFNQSPSWTEELVRFIFIWQIWLGASFAAKNQKHIRVEIIYQYWSPKARRYLEVLVLVLWLAMTMFLTINGGTLVQKIMKRQALSPGLSLPMEYVYASLPVGCGLLSLRLLQQLYHEIAALRGGE